jgi:hypothetical protein
MAGCWNTEYKEFTRDQLDEDSNVVHPRIEFNPTTSHVRDTRCLSKLLLIFSRYNTAIFASTTANAYDRIVVTEGFLQPNITVNATDESNYSYGISIAVLTDMHTAALNGSLLKLDNSDCMARYANTFISKSRNVLLVTTDTNPNHTYLDAS